MLRRVVGASKDLGRLAGGHVRTARTCADQNQLTYQVGGLQGDLLRDHAADGKAEHVDLGKPQSHDEGDGVCTRLLKARRDLAGTARNARVIEEDYLAVPGQAVGYGRIPIIHTPAEMLVEDERHAAGPAETAIGETDAIGLDELRQSGLVRMNHDGRAYYSVATTSGTSVRAALAQSTSF